MQSFFGFPKSRRGQKGFVAVTFAVMITVIVGFAGMAVDTGYLQWNKRRAQLAADAAAMGALRELEKSADANTVSAAGLNDSSMNGFTNGANGTTVEIHNPPISGSYLNHAHAVQAIVRRDVPTIFMRMFGKNSVAVAADAVAETTTVLGNIGGCIFALNKTMKSGLNVNGTTVDVNTNGSVIVESNNSEAFTMGGGAIFKMGHEAKVGVVGGWSMMGQTQILDVSHDPPLVRTPVHIEDPGDPFIAMAAPNVSNVGNTTIRVASGGVAYSKTNQPADRKIWPGVYCGGISIGDTDEYTYTFQPGVYILAGGGFKVTSGDARVNGTGVTFYNTGTGGTAYGAWGCPNSDYTPIGLAGQGRLNFKAPTSGTFVGMLFFGDRNLGTGAGKSEQIVGGSDSIFDGALYFKKGNLKFAGRSSNTGYTVLVADNISINGTTTLGNNYTSLANPNPFAPYSTGGGMVE